MAQAKHDFELIADDRFSARYWAPEASYRGTFALAPGVSPSEAVQDIFRNPRDYGFECATGLVVTYYKALLDGLGPERFDAIMQDLRIGPWETESDLASVLHSSGSAHRDAAEARQSSLRPGDYTYFRNWDVSAESARQGWQGENVISLGGGKYYGHPFGITTGDAIIEYLNRHRNAGSTRSAAMLELQMSLGSNALDLGD